MNRSTLGTRLASSVRARALESGARIAADGKVTVDGAMVVKTDIDSVIMPKM